MKRRRPDFVTDDSDRIKQESFNPQKEEKPKRPKWFRWLLDLVDNIVTALT